MESLEQALAILASQDRNVDEAIIHEGNRRLYLLGTHLYTEKEIISLAALPIYDQNQAVAVRSESKPDDQFSQFQVWKLVRSVLGRLFRRKESPHK